MEVSIRKVLSPYLSLTSPNLGRGYQWHGFLRLSLRAARSSFSPSLTWVPPFPAALATVMIVHTGSSRTIFSYQGLYLKSSAKLPSPCNVTNTFTVLGIRAWTCLGCLPQRGFKTYHSASKWKRQDLHFWATKYMLFL